MIPQLFAVNLLQTVIRSNYQRMPMRWRACSIPPERDHFEQTIIHQDYKGTILSAGEYLGLVRTWPRPRIICPECGQWLVLKWGDERRPHLAHLSGDGRAMGQNCAGGESATHKVAKQIFSELFNAGVNFKFRINCDQCRRGGKIDFFRNSTVQQSVELEYRLPDIDGIADIAILEEGRPSPILTVEIYKSHRTHSRLRREDWVEIDAGELFSAIGENQSARKNEAIELTCIRNDRICGKEYCSMTELADYLGYRFVSEPYASDNEREIKSAMRGSFERPHVQWATAPPYFSDDDGNADVPWPKDHDRVWRRFLIRGRCIRCHKPEDSLRMWRPYCDACHHIIADDNYVHDPVDLVVLPAEEKLRLRKKYSWLDKLEGGWRYGTKCQICNHLGGDDDSPYRTGYVWWFGDKKAICSSCVADLSWLPKRWPGRAGS
jgi:hypothetical protein